MAKYMHDDRDKTIIKYDHILLLLTARLPPFLGRIEAATKMSSSSEMLAIMC